MHAAIESYKDLCREIEIHENILESVIEQIRFYEKMLLKSGPSDITGINLDGMPHGKHVQISMDRIVEALGRLDSMRYIEECTIEGLKAAKEKVDKKMQQLEGLDFKVCYMRDIEGKSLQEIADELGYSYSTISKISAEHKRNKKSESEV